MVVEDHDHVSQKEELQEVMSIAAEDVEEGFYMHENGLAQVVDGHDHGHGHGYDHDHNYDWAEEEKELPAAEQDGWEDFDTEGEEVQIQIQGAVQSDDG